MFFCISFLLIIDTCYQSFIGFSKLCNDSRSHKHPHLCGHEDLDCMRSQISVPRCAPVGLLQWWKALLGKASGNFLALCCFGQKHHTLKKWKKDVNGHIPVSRPTPVERSSNVIICSKSKTPLFVYMITSTGFLFVHSGYGFSRLCFLKTFARKRNARKSYACANRNRLEPISGLEKVLLLSPVLVPISGVVFCTLFLAANPVNEQSG